MTRNQLIKARALSRQILGELAINIVPRYEQAMAEMVGKKLIKKDGGNTAKMNNFGLSRECHQFAKEYLTKHYPEISSPNTVSIHFDNGGMSGDRVWVKIQYFNNQTKSYDSKYYYIADTVKGGDTVKAANTNTDYIPRVDVQEVVDRLEEIDRLKAKAEELKQLIPYFLLD